MLDEIGKIGADAILTVSLIDKETDTRYVPGSYDYAPYPRYNFYGRFWGYYSYWYPVIYTPGYYVNEKTYYIETNLYDANTQELVWSAQSETYSPSGLHDFASEYAQLIAKKLKQENVI